MIMINLYPLFNNYYLKVLQADGKQEETGDTSFKRRETYYMRTVFS